MCVAQQEIVLVKEEKCNREAYGILDLMALNPATHYFHFEIELEALYWIVNETTLTNEGLQKFLDQKVQ